MKSVLTNKGWDEITTQHIEVTGIASKNPIHKVYFWNEVNKQHPSTRRSKMSCDCCKTSWKKLTGGVNLVFTNKGNKTVCDKCLELIKNRIEP